MTLWLVMLHGHGAHDPEGVMSFWTTEAAAEHERDRLTAELVARFGEATSDYFVRAVIADTPNVDGRSLT